MPSLEVVLSPALYPYCEVEGKTVVVIDILRASSAIVSALANGVTAILPVENLEEANSLREQGYLIAGERNGQKVEGFDLGNSPLEYLGGEFKGKEIVLTTTNGTRCIEMSKDASAIYVGAFLNLSSLADHLITEGRDTVLFCAGWKNKFNLEDSLFAGALAGKLCSHFQSECDATTAAMSLYQQYASDLSSFLEEASHVKRFKRLGVVGDKEFCLKTDAYKVIPVLRDQRLIAV